jgi:hypothetical protein
MPNSSSSLTATNQESMVAVCRWIYFWSRKAALNDESGARFIGMFNLAALIATEIFFKPQDLEGLF